MRVLVTGASGFIGSHIVERLVAAGDSVRAFVRPTSDVAYLRALGVELARGDITDPASLPPAMDGIDAVYHAAAAVTDWGLWRLFRSVTVEGTRNVLEAARRARPPPPLPARGGEPAGGRPDVQRRLGRAGDAARPAAGHRGGRRAGGAAAVASAPARVRHRPGDGGRQRGDRPPLGAAP